MSALKMLLPELAVPSSNEAKPLPVVEMSAFAAGSGPAVKPRSNEKLPLNRSRLFTRSDSPTQPNLMLCRPRSLVALICSVLV